MISLTHLEQESQHGQTIPEISRLTHGIVFRVPEQQVHLHGRCPLVDRVL